jgi:hypothetical protein
MSLPTQSTIIPERRSHVASTIRTAALVPTIFEKRSKTADLRDINSSSTLAALKTTDPFMYHSIPACRNAALHSKEVDVSVLRHGNRSIKRKVTRQTRISMECHADVIMEDIIAEHHSIELYNETTETDDDL